MSPLCFRSLILVFFGGFSSNFVWALGMSGLGLQMGQFVYIMLQSFRPLYINAQLLFSGLYINSAHMVLRGHRSIVNQVRFNQANHNIISSGVEKIVKVSITEVWKFLNEKIYFFLSMMEIMFDSLICFFTKHAHRMTPS